jgi:hypothetical protein
MTTQLVTDILRRHSLDGLRFKSSVGPGHNLCIFRPGDFLSNSERGRVLRVEALQYTFSSPVTVITPDSHHLPLKKG